MNQGERKPDGDAREPDRCSTVRRADNHDEKHERHDELADERGT
jgi:hypothetical protein